MGFDLQIGRAAEPPPRIMRGRSRPYRFVSEFEAEIRQMYAQTLDEPVPLRFIEILRAALGARS